MIGLNSQAQARPEMKLGTAQGRNTSAWTTLRPKKGSLSSSARPRPSANWMVSEPKVHQTVFLSACQNTWSATSSR